MEFSNIDNESYCSKCFEKLSNGIICKNCGYDNDTQVDSIYIQPMTIILNDRYAVGAMIEHESDAVTYFGYDLHLDKIITIREFLPKGIANRLDIINNLDIHIRNRYKSSFDELKNSFINLWKTIMKMDMLSAIIPTYDVFECNGTVYAVSEYVESVSLREYLIRQDDGIISWDTARYMFMPVLTTLESLHSNGIIHGGICPDNLLLCRDGKIKLKGFCILEASTMSSKLEFNVNEGYTAIEQYDNNHKVCPATDIYAFSACIYRALVGHNPPNAKSRAIHDNLIIPNNIAEKIPTYVIKALGGGMKIYPQDRTMSFESFREQLLYGEEFERENSYLNDCEINSTRLFTKTNNNHMNRTNIGLKSAKHTYKKETKSSQFQIFKKFREKKTVNKPENNMVNNKKIIQPYSGKKDYIFISYSHKDKKEVYPIIDKLLNDGLRIWYDDGIDPGTEWDENIAKHIEECGYFIPFISENYLKSSNCKDELNFARDLDKDRFLVYLENVNLPSGMNMRLSRLQNIHKYAYDSFDEFYKKLLTAKGINSFK